ncbi:SulP family inorganic anion transporter [Sphingomonas baiyangensis]|uniref:SulP family inorganic anion transporter n=1 Tax=Sphingomonas baiyangensis TaxID=2572576 RepID=A0A4U1L440_9SPHN|nr:SulP family inorganic anion transporter [Sphingomonas baiyangensis]TKD50896.1 SulP family inorganic anion transporter [Sphingomonas baiyangensis]
MSRPFATWRQDVPASIVVALVALPLCLGVALASGAPLFSGLIAGIAGGIVIGFLSKSPLSVSGPAAGLTVIVFAAIERLPTYEAFLLAVVLAGALQIAFSFSRGGVLAEFVPTSVITGMLSAIGLILILKQFPHAVGYDGDPEGDFTFFQPDGMNTFSTMWYALTDSFIWGAALIALVSLVFLFWWDANKPKDGFFRYVPGPLVVVVGAVLLNQLFAGVAPALAIGQTHLVEVPIATSVTEFAGLFTLPDFGSIALPAVWTTAITLAIVASLESLLSVKAVDELDPQRRTTDKNHELLAQGGGNIVSGMLGGLPVTSVIVRSSANVDANAGSKMSTILHGFWLLLSVALIPTVLNLIPLSALAAILIQTGYKLAKPALFRQFWNRGWGQFIPFVATILAILLTDLLVGILIGLAIGFAFVVARNFRPSVSFVEHNGSVMVRARRNLYFIHKYELQAALNRVPDNAAVVVDLTATEYVDPDNIDVINAFIKNASFRGVTVTVRGDLPGRSSSQINAPTKEVVYA